jgi:hypothetical protein
MKMIAQLKLGLLSAMLVLVLALPASAAGDKEEAIKLEDCPAGVQKTIKDNAAGGQVLEVEKETKKDGTVVYEAEVKKKDGKKVDILVAADGKLIKVENEDDDDDDGGDDEDEDDDKANS